MLMLSLMNPKKGKRREGKRKLRAKCVERPLHDTSEKKKI
jgi:hypothetical protein